MCHADSHLDCDGRLHDGNGRRSSVHATAVRVWSPQTGAEIELMDGVNALPDHPLNQPVLRMTIDVRVGSQDRNAKW
jgi:hypothetical protein